MQIDYLADHLELAPRLASWHYQEWQLLLPDWSYEKAAAELRSHTGRCQIPTTLVAIEGARLLGSASLVEEDLDGWEHLSPWVASVFVIPEMRGRGVGRELMNRAIDEATALGISPIYLYTAGQAAYYQKLGWEPWQFTRHHGNDVVIMRHHCGG